MIITYVSCIFRLRLYEVRISILSVTPLNSQITHITFCLAQVRNLQLILTPFVPSTNLLLLPPNGITGHPGLHHRTFSHLGFWNRSGVSLLLLHLCLTTLPSFRVYNNGITINYSSSTEQYEE